MESIHVHRARVRRGDATRDADEKTLAASGGADVRDFFRGSQVTGTRGSTTCRGSGRRGTMACRPRADMGPSRRGDQSGQIRSDARYHGTFSAKELGCTGRGSRKLAPEVGLENKSPTRRLATCPATLGKSCVTGDFDVHSCGAQAPRVERARGGWIERAERLSSSR